MKYKLKIKSIKIDNFSSWRYEIENQNKNEMKWDRAFNIKRYATVQYLMIRYKIR